MVTRVLHCPLCGELDIFGNHKCDPQWYCIHADDYGDDEFVPMAETFTDEGREIFARDAEQAAIKFAEYYQASGAWYPSEMTVLVMDRHEENVWRYIVCQQAVPSYWVEALYEPAITSAVHQNDE